MVEVAHTAQATNAIRNLVESGMPEREIHQLVSSIVKDRPPHQEIDVEDLPIYDELPEGLIDLPTAAKNTGRSTGTIRMWIRNGRLVAVARLRAGAPGGGYLVVREDDLAHIHDITPTRNRQMIP